MAVYIPKNRLGSGPPPPKERRSRYKGNQVTVGMMAEAFEKAKEKAAQKRDEKYQENAEVQRWRTRTTEDKMRDAIDRIVPTMKDAELVRTGKEVSDLEAKTAINERLVNRSDKGGK